MSLEECPRSSRWKSPQRHDPAATRRRRQARSTEPSAACRRRRTAARRLSTASTPAATSTTASRAARASGTGGAGVRSSTGPTVRTRPTRRPRPVSPPRDDGLLDDPGAPVHAGAVLLPPHGQQGDGRRDDGREAVDARGGAVAAHPRDQQPPAGLPQVDHLGGVEAEPAGAVAPVGVTPHDLRVEPAGCDLGVAPLLEDAGQHHRPVRPGVVVHVVVVRHAGPHVQAELLGAGGAREHDLQEAVRVPVGPFGDRFPARSRPQQRVEAGRRERIINRAVDGHVPQLLDPAARDRACLSARVTVARSLRGTGQCPGPQRGYPLVGHPHRVLPPPVGQRHSRASGR